MWIAAIKGGYATVQRTRVFSMWTAAINGRLCRPAAIKGGCATCVTCHLCHPWEGSLAVESSTSLLAPSATAAPVTLLAVFPV